MHPTAPSFYRVLDVHPISTCRCACACTYSMRACERASVRVCAHARDLAVCVSTANSWLALAPTAIECVEFKALGRSWATLAQQPVGLRKARPDLLGAGLLPFLNEKGYSRACCGVGPLPCSNEWGVR